MDIEKKITEMDVFNNVELQRSYGISAMELSRSIIQLRKEADDLEKRVNEWLFGRDGKRPEYQSVVDANLAMMNVAYANAAMKRTFETKNHGAS